MLVNVLKSKLHKARITFCDMRYEGSLAIDAAIMERVGILPGERLLVVNASNGERLETYAIPADSGSGTFGLNGAAARRGAVGDEITVMVFALMSEEEAVARKPSVIVFDPCNTVVEERNCNP